MICPIGKDLAHRSRELGGLFSGNGGLHWGSDVGYNDDSVTVPFGFELGLIGRSADGRRTTSNRLA
jgi:hypothetical protein